MSYTVSVNLLDLTHDSYYYLSHSITRYYRSTLKRQLHYQNVLCWFTWY